MQSSPIHSDVTAEANLSLDDRIETEITVHGAKDLPKGRWTKHPKVKIEITVDNHTFGRKVVARSTDPEWEESFNFFARRSSIITFSLKKQTFSKRWECLGVFETTLDSLREKQDNNGIITCSLILTGQSTGAKPQPSLFLRMKASKGLGANCQQVREAFFAVDIASQDMERIQSAQINAIGLAPGVASESRIVTLSLATVLDSLGAFVNIVDRFASIHPVAKAAWEVLTIVYSLADAQKRRDDQLCDLFETMSRTLGLACQTDKIGFLESCHDIILDIAETARECSSFMGNYMQTTNFICRGLKNAVLPNVDRNIANFQRDFRTLHRSLDTQISLSAAQHAEQSSSCIGRGVKEVSKNVILRDLPSLGKSWDPDRRCFGRTRQDVIAIIDRWVHDVDDQHNDVLLLVGPAGSGKSSVTQSLAALLYDQGCLGSSSFFDDDDPGEDQFKNVFASVARELSARDHVFVESVVRALDNDPSLATACPRRQLKHLVCIPAQRAAEGNPLVVILDGLLECGQAGLLELIASEISKLPVRYRIILTARSRCDIKGSPDLSIKQVTLPRAASDITLYMTARIAELTHLGDNDIHSILVNTLVNLSTGSFQLAKTACDLVEFRVGDPNGWSQHCLDIKHNANLEKRRCGQPQNMTLAEFDELFSAVDAIVREHAKMVDTPRIGTSNTACAVEMQKDVTAEATRGHGPISAVTENTAQQERAAPNATRLATSKTYSAHCKPTLNAKAAPFVPNLNASPSSINLTEPSNPVCQHTSRPDVSNHLGVDGTSRSPGPVQHQPHIVVSSFLNPSAQPFTLGRPYSAIMSPVIHATASSSPLNAQAPTFTPGLIRQVSVAKRNGTLVGSCLNINAMAFTPVEGNVEFVSLMAGGDGY